MSSPALPWCWVPALCTPTSGSAPDHPQGTPACILSIQPPLVPLPACPPPRRASPRQRDSGRQIRGRSSGKTRPRVTSPLLLARASRDDRARLRSSCVAAEVATPQSRIRESRSLHRSQSQLSQFTGVLVHRVTRPLRGSVSCGTGWSVPCVSIQLTLAQLSHSAGLPSGSATLSAPEFTLPFGFSAKRITAVRQDESDGELWR